MTTELSIKPKGHHVVIKPIPLKEKTDSGIIINVEGSMIAKLERGGRSIGTVAAIGPQAFIAHAAALSKYTNQDSVLGPWCEVGETVLYSKHAGRFMYDPMTDEEYYIIHDEDVIAGLPHIDEWKYDLRDKRL